MYSIHFFRSADDARAYRRDKGTGGWIFEPTDGIPSIVGNNDAGAVILFPPSIMPGDIFTHPLTRGRSGRLIGHA